MFGPEADAGGASGHSGAEMFGPVAGGPATEGGADEDGADEIGPISETGGAAGGAVARCHLSAISLGSLGGDGGRQLGRNP